MVSIKFPNMFTASYTNLTEDKNATAQNMRLVILSEKGELFGDPFFGSEFKRLTFDPNDSVLADLARDSVTSCLNTFIPQVYTAYNNVAIEKERGQMNIFIKAVDQKDFVTDLYSVATFER